MDILIENEQTEYEVTEALLSLIEQSVKETVRAENFDEDYEVSITLVSAERIRELNREYRAKDSVTDVLSFITYTEDGFEVYDDEPVMLGDVVICLKRADEQAGEFGHSIEREVAYLVCHSMLHLLGYDHMKAEDKTEMRLREKVIMKTMGLERIVGE
ncbi:MULTISPECIES: rRNA maturation RNase YbeY [unclassified Fusibacter]|uniref:rRNA maturation RNase YbeY n=1 Tax=unclassified Fusibacter TaxID=2624464 RepID=UPI0010123CF4|nr:MULTISPECIES: rRNA maturation RNase YbeY [unclassified Fusibacter]MCK8058107.1 rRNA maturation RNase YbeY [Fusibacter sp. A2]NPE20689.1 rRNA maturation RNase YbeY [Fusibacter sp. A1]RXV62895.1 rRNA maturation RNase YbeY [Fusibacter sp. A1]